MIEISSQFGIGGTGGAATSGMSWRGTAAKGAMGSGAAIRTCGTRGMCGAWGAIGAGGLVTIGMGKSEEDGGFASCGTWCVFVGH